MNSVQLIGRLTADPTANGTPTTSFRLSIDRPGREGTDYLTVKTWQRTAEIAAQHLTRGRRVAIVGRLEHHEWTDPDGHRHSRVEVIAHHLDFLDPPPAHKSAAPAEAATARQPVAAQPARRAVTQGPDR